MLAAFLCSRLSKACSASFHRPKLRCSSWKRPGVPQLSRRKAKAAERAHLRWKGVEGQWKARGSGTPVDGQWKVSGRSVKGQWKGR